MHSTIFFYFFFTEGIPLLYAMQNDIKSFAFIHALKSLEAVNEIDSFMSRETDIRRTDMILRAIHI